MEFLVGMKQFCDFGFIMFCYSKGTTHMSRCQAMGYRFSGALIIMQLRHCVIEPLSGKLAIILV